MEKYDKIQTVYKRDPDTRFRTLLDGQFSTPELEYLAENWWDFTEKVDGTNVRVEFDGKDSVKFGGKTDNSQLPTFLFEKLTQTFTPERFDGVCDCPIVLYGEGFGAKIQKGGGNYNPDGVDFVLFDVKVGEWWLQRDSVVDIANKLTIQYVPIIGQGTLYDMINMAKAGISSAWGDFQAEGIVARPHIEFVARNGSRIITKIKTKDFQ